MKSFLKRIARRIPFVHALGRKYSRRVFPGSQPYWERRYARGGDSGAGSYGRLAIFKAEFVNSFVRDHGIRSVIEFGCGDGNQLSLAEYPSYFGLDVSRSAVEACASSNCPSPLASLHASAIPWSTILIVGLALLVLAVLVLA